MHAGDVNALALFIGQHEVEQIRDFLELSGVQLVDHAEAQWEAELWDFIIERA